MALSYRIASHRVTLALIAPHRFASCVMYQVSFNRILPCHTVASHSTTPHARRFASHRVCIASRLHRMAFASHRVCIVSHGLASNGIAPHRFASPSIASPSTALHSIALHHTEPYLTVCYVFVSHCIAPHARLKKKKLANITRVSTKSP